MPVCSGSACGLLAGSRRRNSSKASDSSLAESLGRGEVGFVLCGGSFPWPSREAVPQPLSLAARKGACCCLLRMSSKQSLKHPPRLSQKYLKNFTHPVT